MNQYLHKVLRTTGLILINLCAAAHAGTSITWSAIAGGSATSSGGSFSLTGTAGQPATSPSAAANCSLVPGFWAADTISSPWLTLTRSGANLVISWPSSLTGFTLQQTKDLTGKPVWSTVSQTTSLVGSQYQVTIPATQIKQFFRLVHP
ncbi:MAG: hypothetical protein C5B50_28120 [Verrucomicrobia bacterium]|nr:MAG: hypothetical protein C5B50_28120 [Verrucomicrobiota bacterium]